MIKRQEMLEDLLAIPGFLQRKPEKIVTRSTTKDISLAIPWADPSAKLRLSKHLTNALIKLGWTLSQIQTLVQDDALRQGSSFQIIKDIVTREGTPNGRFAAQATTGDASVLKGDGDASRLGRS